MTFLMRVCGVAASVLMLTICSAGVAAAEPPSQLISDSVPSTTITLQISPASTAGTTTVTVEVHPRTGGQPTEIRVATNSDPRTPTILGAAIGTTSVKSVSVDMQHPFDWNLGANAPAPTGATIEYGCGPHPPADMPGCSRHQDAQLAPQPAAALAPAAGATPVAAAGQPAPEVAGQQAAPGSAAVATVSQAVSVPPQAISTAAAGQSLPASQAQSTLGSTASTPQAPPTDGGNASTPLSYTVQPGDTLRGIAMRFYGDSDAFDRIARANASRVMPDGLNLVDPRLIRPGWELIIPEPSRAVAERDGARWYTVQPGDTLVGIAARLLGDGQRWPEVYALNRATQLGANSALAAGPSLIRPGMQLLLPDRTSNTAIHSSGAGV